MTQRYLTAVSKRQVDAIVKGMTLEHHVLWCESDLMGAREYIP